MATDLPDLVLIGGCGTGKSTAADYIVEDLGYARFGFVGIAAAPHYGSPRAIVREIWGPEFINDREKLVGMANEARRLDQDVWLRNLSKSLEDPRACGIPVVVDDCRFENEYWGLKARGFVSVRFVAPYDVRELRLKANGKWLSHEYMESDIEHGLDHIKTDYTINNDTADPLDMYEQLASILEREKRRRG